MALLCSHQQRGGQCDSSEQGTASAPAPPGQDTKRSIPTPLELAFASHFRVPETGTMPSFVWVNVFGYKNETIVFVITYISCRLSFIEIINKSFAFMQSEF